jgi:hypothetical protein
MDVLGTLVAEGKLGARRAERTEEQTQEPPESAPV